jgi:hypothetical protein
MVEQKMTDLTAKEVAAWIETNKTLVTPVNLNTTDISKIKDTPRSVTINTTFSIVTRDFPPVRKGNEMYRRQQAKLR